MKEERDSAPVPILRSVAALTAAALVALVIVLITYVREGGAVLARLDRSVGEVLMEEGRRFHEGGARANAMERYTQALASSFAGAQNRATTEKLLGQLLYEMGDFAAALPHLEAATEGVYPQFNAFELRVEALIALDRWDAVPAAIDTWRRVAEGDRDRALAAHYAGRVALHQGDTAAAIAAFEGATSIVPGGRSASELAALYYAAGDRPRALAQIDAYLGSGAPGKRAAWMRNLRARIEREMQSPPR